MATIQDTIERSLDDAKDFSGWDVRKMPELLRRTNPSLMEWARFPIVYHTTPQREHLTREFPAYFDARSNMHHYHSMALSNWRRHLNVNRAKAKKHFHVLRPVLYFRWLEAFATPPPVPFDSLCAKALPGELAPVVDDLLARKKAASKGETITPSCWQKPTAFSRY